MRDDERAAQAELLRAAKVLAETVSWAPWDGSPLVNEQALDDLNLAISGVERQELLSAIGPKDGT